MNEKKEMRIEAAYQVIVKCVSSYSLACIVK
jgi:hypothetical protein